MGERKTYGSLCWWITFRLKGKNIILEKTTIVLRLILSDSHTVRMDDATRRVRDRVPSDIAVYSDLQMQVTHNLDLRIIREKRETSQAMHWLDI